MVIKEEISVFESILLCRYLMLYKHNNTFQFSKFTFVSYSFTFYATNYQPLFLKRNCSIKCINMK